MALLVAERPRGHLVLSGLKSLQADGGDGVEGLDGEGGAGVSAGGSGRGGGSLVLPVLGHLEHLLEHLDLLIGGGDANSCDEGTEGVRERIG